MREKNNYTEQQLVDDFRTGDEKAFSQMFLKLYPSMCFYASQYTRDQPAAEDIAEESFLKVWEKRETFFNYKVLRSYLYVTIRNASLNWIKKERSQSIHKDELSIRADVSEASVLENIVRAEVFNDVYAAFAKLPPKCRQIISMIFFEGKNTREVAEELNLSIGTVKTQKARGLMLLRNRLTLFLLLTLLLN
jgi:RNA polymerase sigma-19 factor, ECF subfamily